MPTPLIRYALDPTGVNPDNFVKDEPVVLMNRRIRAIAPKEGAFYGASLVIKETTTGRTLTQGVHYSPGEYYRTPSEMFGKRVYGIILVNDPAVSSNLTMDYQVVGGEYTGQTDSLKHLLEQYRHDGTEYSYYDVVGKPDAFDPTPHYHSLDDGMNFQYMVHALERLRNAILWADSPAIQDIYTYIETLLSDLDEKLKLKVDAIMAPLLYEFKRTINKATIGLDKVENLGIATQAEGTKAGLQETKIQDFLERKYVALDAIVAFKDSLYNSLVSKDSTNLGRTAATFIPPKKQRLFALPNGAVVTFLSKREALVTADGFDASCFPPGIDENQRVTVVKVINNRNNNGGIFLAYAMDGTKAFIGQHTSGNVVEDISWKRFLFSEDLKVFTDILSAHITNTNNPHKVRKDQVGLSEVENLPVITREEILCLKSVRKYMTFDAFLLFMKAFMIGKNGSAADPGDESGEPLENCQIIYCPCSPCGCGPSGSPPPPSFPPAGQLVSWNCRGFDKWGIYHNGTGGTYDQIIANNSPECGWQPPPSPPPAGQLLGWFCEGTTKIGRYSDGQGGSYNNPMQQNSPDCAGTPPGPTPTPTPPPPAGNPTIRLSFSGSTLPVGPQGLIATTTIEGLAIGKSYTVSYKFKQENSTSFAPYYEPATFVATNTTNSFTFPINNYGDVLPGRAEFIATIVQAGNTSATANSSPAFLTYLGEKRITLNIDGVTTGKDVVIGTNLPISLSFESFPINTKISWSVFADTVEQATGLASDMNSLGSAIENFSTTLAANANIRGPVRYTVVARWSIGAWAGGGVRTVTSNPVTINWTGPTTNNPPAGQEISRACVGSNLVGTYANGSGGSYTQVIAYNSPQCVSAPPPSPTPPSQPLVRTVPYGSYVGDVAGYVTLTYDPSSGMITFPYAPQLVGTSAVSWNNQGVIINYYTYGLDNGQFVLAFMTANQFSSITWVTAFPSDNGGGGPGNGSE